MKEKRKFQACSGPIPGAGIPHLGTLRSTEQAIRSRRIVRKWPARRIGLDSGKQVVNITHSKEKGPGEISVGSWQGVAIVERFWAMLTRPFWAAWSKDKQSSQPGPWGLVVAGQ